jgi:hypothetical protein
MFVDNESLADILYWSAFRNMEINPEKVVSATCPLLRFTREQVQPIGSIELLVTAKGLSDHKDHHGQIFVG